MTWAQVYPIVSLLFLSPITLGSPIEADVQHLPPPIETRAVAKRADINCNDINDRKYFNRDTIEPYLNTTTGYCSLWNAAIGGSDITRYYFIGTMEEVQISISRPDATTQHPSGDHCETNLKEILKGCATNSPIKWNRGGNWVVDGWTYNITAQTSRRPVADAPTVRCKWQGNTAQVSGAGWLGSDFGNEMKAQARTFGYDSKVTWVEDFHYELKDDHEWTVSISPAGKGTKDDIEILLGLAYVVSPGADPRTARVPCVEPTKPRET
ncbi:hypothetical protein BCR34DRAFT_600607 [Clohesyomyces aquaticus]|uniref:Ecp2 effector protein domain-containing protein n=1 Tax=Clohesyomyces aquaticus TaxID=1231657 RepID=A0A1Y1ZRG7_9PLEO|nr:hypothetical protein BCR34DRAFT_600607 [Clohesyomyces aquaticus]